jgi:hypothetical protein
MTHFASAAILILIIIWPQGDLEYPLVIGVVALVFPIRGCGKYPSFTRSAGKRVDNSPFAISPLAVRSARALDGDEVVAGATFARARAAGRNGTGYVVAIDLAEGHGLREFVRVAVCIRRGLPAGCARCKAAIDAVTVGVIGDDEYPLFGLRGAGAEKHGRDGDNHQTHESPLPN